jgi:hypothetical protein
MKDLKDRKKCAQHAYDTALRVHHSNTGTGTLRQMNARAKGLSEAAHVTAPPTPATRPQRVGRNGKTAHEVDMAKLAAQNKRNKANADRPVESTEDYATLNEGFDLFYKHTVEQTRMPLSILRLAGAMPWELYPDIVRKAHVIQIIDSDDDGDDGDEYNIATKSPQQYMAEQRVRERHAYEREAYAERNLETNLENTLKNIGSNT